MPFGRGWGRGFGFRGYSPPWPYVGRGRAYPGAGRTVNLGLRLMPRMGITATAGPTPHMVCHKDIGTDIHIMAILIDNKK
jgi:hypothetical protein